MPKYHKTKKEIPIPPADVILDLLNNEPNFDEEFLDFYDNYVKKISTESCFSSDGTFCGYFLNEDLVQEIKIAIIKCLPGLRNKVLDILNNKSIIVIIPPET